MPRCDSRVQLSVVFVGPGSIDRQGRHPTLLPEPLKLVGNRDVLLLRPLGILPQPADVVLTPLQVASVFAHLPLEPTPRAQHSHRRNEQETRRPQSHPEYPAAWRPRQDDEKDNGHEAPQGAASHAPGLDPSDKRVWFGSSSHLELRSCSSRLRSKCLQLLLQSMVASAVLATRCGDLGGVMNGRASRWRPLHHTRGMATRRGYDRVVVGIGDEARDSARHEAASRGDRCPDGGQRRGSIGCSPAEVTPVPRSRRLDGPFRIDDERPLPAAHDRVDSLLLEYRGYHRRRRAGAGRRNPSPRRPSVPRAVASSVGSTSER